MENKTKKIPWKARTSLWSETCDIENREGLPRDCSTEVVVIGAGLLGILTAYMLQSNGIDTIVVEADRVGSGVTGNTTAKVTSQHNLVYHNLIKGFGMEKAEQYAMANEWAIENYKRLVDKKEIDCDWEDQPAYLYTLEEEHVAIVEAEAEAAKTLGIHASLLKEAELQPRQGNVGSQGAWGLPFPAKAAVRFENQAMFHPLKFLKAMADEVIVYEKTRVLDVSYKDDGVGQSGENKSTVVTDQGTLTAKHVVFACHYPLINVPGYYFARLHQERSYLLALENGADVGGMYLGVDQMGYTFRNYKDLLIFGGAGHRTGQNQDGGSYKEIRKAAKKWYPQAQEVSAWSAQDCIPMDGVPYIGRYSERRPTWYVGTGFRKWGMTHSMVGAGIISAMIAKRPLQPGISSFMDLNREEENIYCPKRFSVPVSGEYLWKDVKTIGQALLKEIFNMPNEKLDAVELGHGGVISHQEEKIGVYKSPDGQITMVNTRCTHMGCELAWNPEELTWDCPCHGSRFDYQGNLVSGPATKNLERQEDADTGIAEE